MGETLMETKEREDAENDRHVGEIPMLFSAPMIRALLAGRKTQTRRVAEFKGKPGDLIWVRESWRTYVSLDEVAPVDLWKPGLARGAALFYEAGGGMNITRGGRPHEWSQHDEDDHPGAGRLRASMHLPKWGSRITLRVTSVFREPLNFISGADALAEGVEMESADPPFYYVPGIWPHSLTAVGVEEPGGRHAERSYAKLWEHINGAGSWAANPAVSVIGFEVVRENIISMRSKPAPDAP